MGQVEITYPYEGAYVDPDDMRAQLEAIASAVNVIDSTQLVDGAVLERHIADEQVSLAKLKGGQFVLYGATYNSQGLYPGENTTNPYEPLYFDGGTGPYHASKLVHFRWREFSIGGYRLARRNGSLMSFTPPVDCVAIIIGNIRLRCYGASNGKAVKNLYVAVYNSAGTNDPADVSRHLTESQTADTSDTDWIANVPILGFVPISRGTAVTLRIAIKPIIAEGVDGQTTANCQIYTPEKNTFVGVLMMPGL